MSQGRAEFANFLCHFGQDRVLLDYLEDVILPAFTDDTMVRSRGSENQRHYHFHDVQLVILKDENNNPVVGISGHHVKDINLIRTQRFDRNYGLVEDHQSMESSPSSFFLLVFNDHKLAYYPETPHAPSVKEFQSTVRSFAAKKYDAFINERYRTLNERRDKSKVGSKITKKRLRSENPAPQIDVVAFTNPTNVRDFVLRFEKLSNLDFRLLRPNPTFDAGETFGQVREVLHELEADSAKLSTSNKEDGLNKEAAIRIITQATQGGNQEISLKGITPDGSDLKGSNDDFKASTPIKNTDGTRRGLIESLYKSLVVTTAASLGATDHTPEHKSIINKLAELARKLVDEQ